LLIPILAVPYAGSQSPSGGDAQSQSYPHSTRLYRTRSAVTPANLETISVRQAHHRQGCNSLRI